MTWTINDVVTQSRDLLQDAREPYRFSTSRLVSVFNLGLSEVRRLRPDLLLNLDWNVPFYTDSAADLATEFPLDEQYFAPLIDYVVARTALSDDEFTVDGRAMAFYQMFTGKQVVPLGG